jgi:hypothetical protein
MTGALLVATDLPVRFDRAIAEQLPGNPPSDVILAKSW